MSDAPSADLPPASQRRIDLICHEFESAWRLGQQPRIEDFVANQRPEHSRRLLYQLVMVEFRLRVAAGEPLEVGDYVERFADQASIIQAAIQRFEPECAGSADTIVWDESQLAAQGGTPSETANWPDKIGKYLVNGLLGTGAMGAVYLARHPQLDRAVAIKVPRLEFCADDAAIQRFLNEARHIARVKHAGIVSVYDVDQEGARPFIVQEYIEGPTLRAALRARKYSAAEVARLIMSVAEAIAHAHEQGVYHRDLKPSNILLDQQGRPYVADFGIALREDLRRQSKGERCGTPHFMPPEMVRGESHRIDGRCDIWSLGVICYEMLAGELPFHGADRRDLFDDILHTEPRPLRQIKPSIPMELERICLKCLAKRVTDRYATAVDLASDLRDWLSQDGTRPVVEPEVSQQQSALAPRGLRAFTEEDADFFLELLPGPRTREGLPECIRFWKSRIESTDADRAFPVGIIYGPSGSGKSSLVRAGLLPRIDAGVLPLYVEATPENTELRLLNELHSKLDGLPQELALPDLIAHLRTHSKARGGKKLLVVFDQFEQWLHSTLSIEGSQLVETLRQCDGRNVQAVVLVRDDFWMAATRFFHALEVDLVEGENAAAVDRFDLRHARRVLLMLGQAYGALPIVGELSGAQDEFLAQSVQALAEDEQVVSVRLALFAQMVKGKPWTPPTLKAAGGAEGIGVAFLEGAFGAAASNPKYRAHAQAAEQVLKALLPDAGIDLKGHMQSFETLAQESGYHATSREFEELLNLLDTELRLITPTDPLGRLEESAAASGPSRETRFQLTHDFLVPAVRNWTTRRQRATRRGRAELRLAECEKLWTTRKNSKQLPTLWEWLGITLYTRRRTWNPNQRLMMRTAATILGRRLVLAAAILLLVVFALADAVGRSKASSLVHRLQSAKTNELPAVIEEMEPYRWRIDARLHELQKSAAPPELKWVLRLALLPADPSQAGDLLHDLLAGEPDQVGVIANALSGHASVHEPLWAVVQNPEETRITRLRAASALAIIAPDDAKWRDHGAEVTEWLVSAERRKTEQWAELLQPVRGHLIASLTKTYHASSDVAVQQAAAEVLTEYLNTDPRQLTQLALAGKPSQLAVMSRSLEPHHEVVRPALLERLSRVEDFDPRVNAAAILLRLGAAQAVWPLLQAHPDQELRSHIVHRAAAASTDPEVLVAALTNDSDPSIQRAILLILAGIDLQSTSRRVREIVVQEALKQLEMNSDPGVHAAAQWLLRMADAEPESALVTQRLRQAPQRAGVHWYVNSEEHEMAILPGGRFARGSPESEADREADEPQYEVEVAPFEIAMCEVTKAQFIRFRPDYGSGIDGTAEARLPANLISLADAMHYCNWLSGQEGMREDDWCYVIENQRISPRPDFLARPGYRLPTEAEWEFACRAGTQTSRYFGSTDRLLASYGWYLHNSDGKTHPVGRLIPNDLGLFDAYGNVEEWCQDRYTSDPRDAQNKTNRTSYVTRGGSTFSSSASLRSAGRRGSNSASKLYFIGFRIARSAVHQSGD